MNFLLMGILLLIFGAYWVRVVIKQKESSYRQVYWGTGGIFGGLALILWGIIKVSSH